MRHLHLVSGVLYVIGYCGHAIEHQFHVWDLVLLCSGICHFVIALRSHFRPSDFEDPNHPPDPHP